MGDPRPHCKSDRILRRPAVRVGVNGVKRKGNNKRKKGELSRVAVKYGGYLPQNVSAACDFEK